MSSKIYISFIISTCLFTGFAYSREIRSNHSYRNLGFTQLPTVSIGGYIDANIVKATQEDIYSEEKLENVFSYDGNTTLKNRATDKINFSSDASLLFKINGVNDYGFKYGAVMELNANSTYNSWNKDLNATKSFIYGETIVGKIEFGNELGASQKMKVDAGSFARGAGGINGKYLNFINLPSIVTGDVTNTPLFILIPQHPTAHGGFGVGFNNLLYRCDFNGDGTISGIDESSCYNESANDNYRLYFEEMQNATKISYYTPEIYGFQAGISYTPDTGNKGTSSYLTSRLDTGDIDDVIEYGLTYSDTFYGLGISLSFTGELGKSESKVLSSGNYESFRENLNSMQFGGMLTFYGLTVGGSYGDWGTSLYNKNTEKKSGDGKYKTFGFGYEFAGFNASATYLNSEFQTNKYTAYSIGVDYKVANGFMPYIEYTKYEFEANNNINIKNNSGYVVLAGFILNF